MTDITVQRRPEEFKALQFDGSNFNEFKAFVSTTDYFAFAVGVIASPDSYAGLGSNPILVFKSATANQGFVLIPQGWWAVYLNEEGWSAAPTLDGFVEVTV